TIRPHRPEHSLETSEPGATRAIDIPTGRNTTLPIGRHRSISTTSPLSTDPGLTLMGGGAGSDRRRGQHGNGMHPGRGRLPEKNLFHRLRRSTHRGVAELEA